MLERGRYSVVEVLSFNLMHRSASAILYSLAASRLSAGAPGNAGILHTKTQSGPSICDFLSSSSTFTDRES